MASSYLQTELNKLNLDQETLSRLAEVLHHSLSKVSDFDIQSANVNHTKVPRDIAEKIQELITSFMDAHNSISSKNDSEISDKSPIKNSDSEAPIKEAEKVPINETNKFKMQTKVSDSGSNLEFISMPDKEISEIKEQVIGSAFVKDTNREIDKRFSRVKEKESESGVFLTDQSAKKLTSDDIEEIQENIKEAEMQKFEVEAELEKIRDSIGGLDSLESFGEDHRKPNVEDKIQPMKNYEEAKKKTELNSKKLKQLREDQVRREQALAKELEKINKKIEKQRKQLQKEEENLKDVKSEEYKVELQKMHEKKIQRKKELDEIKRRQKDLEAVKSTKPLYVKIEEKYRKELSPGPNKKSPEFVPISSIDFQEHAKWYDEVKKEHQKKSDQEFRERLLKDKIRASSYGRTNWTNKVLEDDRKMKSELNRASQERLQMIEKKTRYAKFVKEIYSPTIDRLKRQESEPKIKNRVGSYRSPVRDRSNEGFKQSERPKKFKENPLVPKPLPKKEPKVIDFLEERRKVRQEERLDHGEIDFDWEKDLEKDIPDHEKARMIKKKAKLLERESRKQELLIGAISPTNAKTIKQSEAVNDLLLNSIKAKLAVLDHKNN